MHHQYGQSSKARSWEEEKEQASEAVRKTRDKTRLSIIHKKSPFERLKYKLENRQNTFVADSKKDENEIAYSLGLGRWLSL